MIIDQQNSPPANYIVAGADFQATYPRNAAAFNLLDLFIHFKRFTLQISQKIGFTLDG